MTVKYVSKIFAPSCQCRALVFRVTIRVSFRQDTKIRKSITFPKQGNVCRHEWQQQAHLKLHYHRLYLIRMHISPIQSFRPICLANCKHLRRAQLAECFLALCTGDTCSTRNTHLPRAAPNSASYVAPFQCDRLVV